VNRVAASRAAWEVRRKTQKKKTSGGGSTSSAIPASKWVTPSSQKVKGRPVKTKKTNQPRGGGVFAAMMMDSDSD